MTKSNQPTGFDELIDFLDEEGVLVPGNAHWPPSPPQSEQEEINGSQSNLDKLESILNDLNPSGEETDETSEVDWSKLFPSEGIFRNEKMEREIGGFSKSAELYKDLYKAAEIFEDRDWRRLRDTPWENDLSEDFLDDFFEGVDKGIDKEELGFDTCAWYSQIHFNLYDWGIKIKNTCLISIGKKIARHLPYSYKKSIKSQPYTIRNILSNQCMLAAFHYLYLHEIYHHKVESIGIRFLITRGRDSYVRYMDNLYSKLIGSDDQLEEALATAHSLLKLNTSPYNKNILPAVMKASKDRIEKTLPYQPPGYRNAVKYLSTKSFESGEHELQSRVQEGTIRHCIKRKKGPSRWKFGQDMMRGLYTLNNRIYEIVTPSSPKILPSKGAAPFVCSTTEASKACYSDGWDKIKKGGKGSHIKMDKPGKRPIIIPGNRKSLSTGVLKNIMSSLGVNEEEFKDMIKRKGKK